MHSLPGFNPPPAKPNYQQVARLAVNAARQCDRDRNARKAAIMRALRYGAHSRAALDAACNAPHVRSLDEPLRELVAEGKVIHGPQGWSVK